MGGKRNISIYSVLSRSHSIINHNYCLITFANCETEVSDANQEAAQIVNKSQQVGKWRSYCLHCMYIYNIYLFICIFSCGCLMCCAYWVVQPRFVFNINTMLFFCFLCFYVLFTWISCIISQLLLHCMLVSGTVYWVCLWECGCVYLSVCYHDKSILTKLGL